MDTVYMTNETEATIGIFHNILLKHVPIKDVEHIVAPIYLTRARTARSLFVTHVLLRYIKTIWKNTSIW